VTEIEWLTLGDARLLLHHLGGQASRRKLRLFACACCRRSGLGMDTWRGRKAVEMAERFAGGSAPKREMAAARSAARGLPRAVADASARKAACAAAARDSPAMGAAALLRELFGNPFRPVTADPAWLAWNGSTVLRIAKMIDEQGDFAALPVLADALEEAGCSSAPLLEHCRVPAGHAPGCWALDLILARE
jgi:hypothetical protein